MAFLYRSLWIVMRVQASCEQSQSFENEYFCTMLLVIASVEQCHGICHRNTALKSINKAFLTCWRKKKKKKQDTNISYLELHMFRAGSSGGSSGSLCFAELLQRCCRSSAPCPELALRGATSQQEQAKCIPAPSSRIAECSHPNQSWFCLCNILHLCVH